MYEGTNIRTKYKIGKQIGTGSYGVVVLGVNRNTKLECAIKIINKKNLSEKNELDFAKREIEILRDLEHPHIVKVHEFFDNKH